MTSQYWLRITAVLIVALTIMPLAGCSSRSVANVTPDHQQAMSIREKLLKGTQTTGSSSAAPAVQATAWGTLSGRFVLTDSAPSPAPIAVTKDVEVCGKHPLVDESLVVAKDGGIANVVIWVSSKNVSDKPATDKPAAMKVVLDNKGCRFEPHLIALRAGQPFAIHNSDPIGHNSNVTFQANSAANPIIAPETEADISADAPETMPVQVTCNIHPWMKGWIVVRPNSLYAVTAPDGKFEIKDVPAGEWEFQVWQEKSGYVQAVTLDGKAQQWEKGKFKYTIKPDANNDLGEIQVAAEVFNK